MKKHFSNLGCSNYNIKYRAKIRVSGLPFKTNLQLVEKGFPMTV
jgi:hypothetical protein